MDSLNEHLSLFYLANALLLNNCLKTWLSLGRKPISLSLLGERKRIFYSFHLLLLRNVVIKISFKASILLHTRDFWGVPVTFQVKGRLVLEKCSGA